MRCPFAEINNCDKKQTNLYSYSFPDDEIKLLPIWCGGEWRLIDYNAPITHITLFPFTIETKSVNNGVAMWIRLDCLVSDWMSDMCNTQHTCAYDCFVGFYQKKKKIKIQQLFAHNESTCFHTRASFILQWRMLLETKLDYQLGFGNTTVSRLFHQIICCNDNRHFLLRHAFQFNSYHKRFHSQIQKIHKWLAWPLLRKLHLSILSGYLVENCPNL